MRKKFVKVMFFGALALSTVTYVGCKDYDDDIDKLQTQIDANKADIAKLQALLNEGNWVTEVKGIENGFSITFNNGQSYEIVNGEKGATGDAGSKVTIDEETGEWLIDGAGTGWFAKVENGKSPYIADGTNGDKGYWYFWDEEAGEFVKGDKAQGEPGQSVTGPSGKSPYIDADGFWQYYDDATSAWVKGPKAAGSNGKDAVNPFIGEDGYWYYWDVNAEDGKGKLVKGEYAGTGTWVVKDQDKPSYTLYINEEKADGTYEKVAIILPVAEAISSMDVVSITDIGNKNYKIEPGMNLPITIYYGTINKEIEFHGKKYGAKDKTTTLVGRAGADLYAVINPVDVDFSEYSVKLINSFGEEKFNLKQEKFKSEKPLTRAEQENVGVYKFTVTPTTNITDDMKDQAIAYALKTTDAYGQEIISKYDAKVTVTNNQVAIDPSNMTAKIRYTEAAKLDELFAGELAKVADRYYIIDEAELKNAGATFDRETSTITATKKGTVAFEMDYLETNGNVGKVNVTVHFQDISGEDLSIAPVSYTLKHDQPQGGFASAEITADNNPTLFALLNKVFNNTSNGNGGKPTVKIGSVKFAAGKVTVDGKEVEYQANSIKIPNSNPEPIVDKNDNSKIIGYSIEFAFDAASVTATEHDVVINVINPDYKVELADEVLEKVAVKVTVNNPGVFEFKPLSAYFNGNSAVTYAKFENSYSTITEDLYKLFEAISDADKALITFDEERPNFGTADNPELGDAWLDAPNTQNSVITVPAMKAEKNDGVYSTRKLTLTYQPFGNTNLAKISKSFDLTVKSSIYEGVMTKGKYLVGTEKSGKFTALASGVLALDSREFTIAPTNYRFQDMTMSGDFVGNNYVKLTGADKDGRVSKVALKLEGEISKYAHIETSTDGTTWSGTSTSISNFDSEVKIALNADFVVVQSQMTGFVTMVVTDAWGATSEVKYPVTLKESKNDK